MLCLEKNEILLLTSGVEVLKPGQNNCFLNSENFEQTKLFSKWEKFRQINEETKLMFITTKGALDNAKIDINKLDKTKIGLVFCTTFGSFSNYENFEESIITCSLKPQEFVCSLASFVSSAVSVFFGIKGPCITFSGLYSFIDVMLYSYELIENNVCEVVIIGEWVKFSKTLLNYFGKEYNSEVFSVMVLEKLDCLYKRKHSFCTEIKINRNFCFNKNELLDVEELTNFESFLGITTLSQKIKVARQYKIKKFLLSYNIENKTKLNFLCENKNL